MKNFLIWLFNDANGHFAIASALLAIATAAWFLVLFVKPPATVPVGAAVLVLWQLFLTKLKGS